MNKKRNQILTITTGAMSGVYEVDRELEMAPSNNADGGNLCHCCGQVLKAAFDVMQLGFWDDAYETYFVCKPCRKASVYKYTLSRIEPVGKKRGKKASEQSA